MKRAKNVEYPIRCARKIVPLNIIYVDGAFKIEILISTHIKKTSSPKGNDRSPESQSVKKIFLDSSQVSKRFFSDIHEQLTPQSMV